ncbi:hypothetical protein SAMN04488515_2795 [Cognatiyoonia koreensis]|uniref:FlgN protein n=1 Tax=Cognatiyoonia koreensis TaxID=364200 RepID=A0A1I0RLE5_9RHOB|nr:hypothetical protein [Cognatiyoonia koreensis]SEW41186.1 hypothetical protein SAMN04488515_2795 [Cognatiyoonia koreensis]
MPSDSVMALLLALDREGDALRKGELASLPAIAEEKARLAAEIQKRPVSNQDIEILRAKASANANLLAAAIRGIKTARSRLDALSDVRNVLSVYGPAGRMERVPTKRSDLERKA